MKPWIKTVIGIAIVLVVFSGVVLYLSQFHLDFSQDFRRIDGYENIVFKDSKSSQCFRLFAWGLIKTGNVDGFEDHRNPDGKSDEYQLIVENANARECDIWQVVTSPDGKRILYVEKIYNGSGVTDDEQVNYKVYSMEDGTTITIYSGYRQYLLVDWK
ncbi:MAG: hypothetical protein J5623_09360 [Clostridiales bacterium]|nr:hypothetical protein [Clostridiales bacterium]